MQKNFNFRVKHLKDEIGMGTFNRVRIEFGTEPRAIPETWL